MYAGGVGDCRADALYYVIGCKKNSGMYLIKTLYFFPIQKKIIHIPSLSNKKNSDKKYTLVFESF